MAAWFGPTDGGQGQDLLATLLGDDAAPLGPAHSLAHLASGPELMVVRPATEVPQGWTLVWSALLDRGEVLTSLGVAAGGTPSGSPAEIHRTSDHIAWLDVLPVARGALTVWVEETPSGDANVLVDAIDANGKPRGAAMRVARGVAKWQAVSAAGKAGLALFTTAADDAHQRPGGTLTWQGLDGDGRPEGSAISVAGSAAIGGDIQVVPFRDGWLLAWTDLGHEDPRVALATIDPQGQAHGPNPAFEAGGPSSLVTLSSNGQEAAMAWSESHRRAGDTQVVRVGLVSADGGSMGKPVAALDVGLLAAPELVPSDAGFALLAPARACWAELAGRPCTGPIVPTFVRFGPGLDPIQSEPFLLGDPRKPATLGWGLSCGSANRCIALAATSETPTPVFSVDLPMRSSPFATPTIPPPPAHVPRVTQVRTVASGASFADLGATRLGDKTLVATLTIEDGATSTRRSHGGGAISTFLVESEGPSLAEARPLSSRAASISGVAVASGGEMRDGAIVAWISRSQAAGEVRLAQISATGRLLHSLRLAPADSDTSSVAVAWTGDGWLVAWVDGRNAGAQVYATKVGRQLQHRARSARVTRAAVAPADLAVAARGDVAWIAWSDARESPREGVADIYAMALHAADATPASDEVRVLATARHSRSPTLASASGDGALIAWIEDAPQGVDARAVTMIGCLDRSSRVSCPTVELPLAGPGQPASIELAPARDEVHAIVARWGVGGGVTLDGLRLGTDGAPLVPPWPLVVLDTPASVDVSLAIAGDGVVFSDVVAGPGQRRLRLAEIAWSP
jgi:hypothetical protein